MLRKLLTGLLIISMVSSISISLSRVRVYANTEVSASTDVKIVNNAQYLSDFKNLQASTGWKSMTIDKDTDNNKLHLLVDNERVEFDRGIYAHTDSTLRFDISNRAEGFDRFVTRIGINNNSSSNRSDGAVFTIQLSKDGTVWETVKGYDKLYVSSTEDSKLVDFVIPEGTKEIKLIAGKHGHNTCDGATYAEAKLVKLDYKESDNYNSAILKTEEYDKDLNSKTIEENLKDKKAIYKREFVDRFGYYTLQKFYSESEDNKKVIDYIFNSEECLRLFIEAGEANPSDDVSKVLDNFKLIYDKYSSDFSDSTMLKLGVATAWAGGSNIVFWAGGQAQDIVERYSLYKEFVTVKDKPWSWTQEQIDVFSNLSVSMMKYTVDSRQNNDEMKWFADYIKNTKKGSFDAYSYVEYKGVYPFNQSKYYGENAAQYIKKYKMENYDIDTTDPDTIRWYAVMEIDGVCGALAKTYASLRETFGYPAGVVNQPGHAATILYNGEKWQLTNDVYGWSKSRDEMGQMPLSWGMQSWNSDRSASYVLLTQDVVDNKEAFTKAYLINILAEAKAESGDNKGAQNYYKEALAAQPNNLDSMYGLIQSYLADESKVSSDYLELQDTIADTFKLYPLPMLDLMKLIESKVTGEDTVKFDLRRNEALADSADTTVKEHKQYDVIKNMSNALTGNTKVEMATFSFDGENAGKIMMNEKYATSEIRVQYSLDGGKKWTDSSEQEIKLSDDELASITAENDIRVRLVGDNNNIFVIDIKEGVTPSTSTYKFNDLENFILGDISHLEFKNNSTGKWIDYKEKGVFSGDNSVTFRNKAFGTTLQSEEGNFKFTNNENKDGRSYIKISDVKVTGASSHNANQKPELAIDGDVTTAWHSSYSGEVDKWITFEFNEAKNLHSFDFSVGSFNGIIKTAEIYTSTDGKDWKLVDTVSANRQKANQTVKFNKEVNTKYLKIKATETYGNSNGELNKYFALTNINFFEVAE